MIWPVLARAELVLLRRSPLALANAVVMPVAAALGWMLLARDSPTGLTVDAVAMQALLLLACTPYLQAVTMLAARRQERVLKRLRESALTPAGAWAGLMVPLMLLGVVQTALLIGVTMAAGLDPPARWWPLVVAVVLGLVFAVPLAVATAVVTPAPELAQLTAVPGFLALFGGGFWALNGGSWAFLLPGGALTELVRLAWQTDAGWLDGWRDVAVIAVTTAVAALASRFFRWDPRTV
ncbi:ABC transporter permease [Actinoplanes sp. NPDC049265]|uniref:ABC transporter permease n=1 Tax=Actinoplanes sp. NPDC049265 TaxID=3363902 RepID=UPI003713C33D